MPVLAGLSGGMAVQSSQSPIVDPTSGIPTPEFYRWMLGLRAERPAFSAYKSAVVSPVSPDFSGSTDIAPATVITSTQTPVFFDIELFDIGNLYDTSTSEWTPSAGIIYISCQLLWNCTVSNKPYVVFLFKNGGVFKSNVEFSGTGPQFVPVALSVCDLASGTDVYSIYSYHEAGVPQDIFGFTNATFFSGFNR